MRLSLAVVLASLAYAGAAKADGYPQVVVDRPLVLPPDMTEADVGVDFPTYAIGLSSHTALGRYYDADVSLHHAFGPVQLGVRFVDDVAGPTLGAGPRVMLGPGALDLDVSFRMPSNASGLDHQDEEDIRYTLKSIVVPSGFAVYADAGVTAEQYADTYQMSASHLFAAAEGGLELALVPELTVTAGASVASQLDDPINDRFSFATGGQLTYVYDRFDVYANLWVYDLAHTRMPYAGVGVVTRFGG